MEELEDRVEMDYQIGEDFKEKVRMLVLEHMRRDSDGRGRSSPKLLTFSLVKRLSMRLMKTMRMKMILKTRMMTRSDHMHHTVLVFFS